MDVATILAPGSVRCERQVTSKKNALEILSDMLAAAGGEPARARTILDAFAARERLGSTGLGASVAMPHARIGSATRVTGAFLKLDEPVKFDAPDALPVDLLFGLAVPEDSTEEQIKEIRALVKKLRDPELQRMLRSAEGAAELYDILTDHLTVVPPRPLRRRAQT